MQCSFRNKPEMAGEMQSMTEDPGLYNLVLLKMNTFLPTKINVHNSRKILGVMRMYFSALFPKY